MELVPIAAAAKIFFKNEAAERAAPLVITSNCVL